MFVKVNMLNLSFPVLLCIGVLTITCTSSVMVKNRWEQCQDLGYAGVCYHTPKKYSSIPVTCKSLICSVKIGKGKYVMHVTDKKPADGSQCEGAKICINEECVDYTGNPKFTYPIDPVDSPRDFASETCDSPSLILNTLLKNKKPSILYLVFGWPIDEIESLADLPIPNSPA